MKNKNEKKPLSYNLSVTVHKAIEGKAKADNRSKSDWLNLHLIDLFNEPDDFMVLSSVKVPKLESEFLERHTTKLKEIEDEFNLVWNIYEKKGNKKTSFNKFNKLTKANKKLLTDYLPKYVKATPNKAFRKNFETFINQEAWNDALPVVVDKYGKQDVPRSAAYVAPTISDRQAELEKERQAEAQRERNRQKLKQRNIK